MVKDFALIGDIHSQLGPLRAAIRYCEQEGLFPVFLGDVFDSRTESSDSVSVYFTLRELTEKGDAIVLRSNHQDKLEKFIRQIPTHTPQELLRTVDEMEAAGVYHLGLLKWLESLPHGFCFRDSEGKEFRCAHAFFPSWLEVPEYEESVEIRPDKKQAKWLMCYGPNHTERKGRRFWWLDQSKKSWVRVAGHYHVVYSDEYSLVLDGGCGGVKRSWFCDESPMLAIYNSREKKIIEIASQKESHESHAE